MDEEVTVRLEVGDKIENEDIELEIEVEVDAEPELLWVERAVVANVSVSPVAEVEAVQGSLRV